MQCMASISLSASSFYEDMSKGPEQNQKLDLITCQNSCLASVLKAKTWTDRFHKENEESLYSSSEFHYLLEFTQRIINPVFLIIQELWKGMCILYFMITKILIGH